MPDDLNLVERLHRLSDHAADKLPVPAATDVRRRGDRRRLQRRSAGVGGLVVVAVAAVIGGGYVLNDGVDGSLPTRPASSGPSTTPIQHPTGGPASSHTATVPAHQGRVDLGPITLALPASWVAYDQGHWSPIAPDQSGSHLYCLAPDQGPGTTVWGCAGLQIYVGGQPPGFEGAPPYRPHQAQGWFTATDPGYCPVDPRGGPAGENVAAVGPPSEPVLRGLRAVGSRTAAYDKWTATCGSGYTYHPQAWWLGMKSVLIKDYLSHTQTAAILASADFS